MWGGRRDYISRCRRDDCICIPFLLPFHSAVLPSVLFTYLLPDYDYDQHGAMCLCVYLSVCLSDWLCVCVCYTHYTFLLLVHCYSFSASICISSAVLVVLALLHFSRCSKSQLFLLLLLHLQRCLSWWRKLVFKLQMKSQLCCCCYCVSITAAAATTTIGCTLNELYNWLCCCCCCCCCRSRRRIRFSPFDWAANPFVYLWSLQALKLMLHFLSNILPMVCFFTFAAVVVIIEKFFIICCAGFLSFPLSFWKKVKLC